MNSGQALSLPSLSLPPLYPPFPSYLSLPSVSLLPCIPAFPLLPSSLHLPRCSLFFLLFSFPLLSFLLNVSLYYFFPFSFPQLSYFAFIYCSPFPSFLSCSVSFPHHHFFHFPSVLQACFLFSSIICSFFFSYLFPVHVSLFFPPICGFSLFPFISLKRWWWWWYVGAARVSQHQAGSLLSTVLYNLRSLLM